jgi:hypothetical protein
MISARAISVILRSCDHLVSRLFARLAFLFAACFAACSDGLLDSAAAAPLPSQSDEGNVGRITGRQGDPPDLQPSLGQPLTPVGQAQPGPSSKVEETAKKKVNHRDHGTVTKPTFFALVEQTSSWMFPGTGAAWGPVQGLVPPSWALVSLAT